MTRKSTKKLRDAMPSRELTKEEWAKATKDAHGIPSDVEIKVNCYHCKKLCVGTDMFIYEDKILCSKKCILAVE